MTSRLLKRVSVYVRTSCAILIIACLNVSCGMYDDTYAQLSKDLVGIWEGEHKNSRWCVSYLGDGSMSIAQIRYYNPADPADNRFSWQIHEGIYEVVKGQRIVHRMNKVKTDPEQRRREQQAMESLAAEGQSEAVGQKTIERLYEAKGIDAPKHMIEEMHVLTSVDQEKMVYYALSGDVKFTAERKQQCSDIFNF